MVSLFHLADLELDLTVKIRNGETLNLLVKPSFSIKEIKTQIESLKEIPEKDQILTLNGVILEDTNKLAKYLFIFYYTRKLQSIKNQIN